jgi:hypothetical protein
MLASQSNTLSLSQLPEAHAPLLLHPSGMPFMVDEQEVQLIKNSYLTTVNSQPHSNQSHFPHEVLVGWAQINSFFIVAHPKF